MKRKIVRQGTSTYMISLPKKWIDLNNIQKGQELNVETEEKNVKISCDKIDVLPKKKKLFIDEYTTQLIYQVYRLGYFELDIKLETREDSREVSKIINNLIGADIIEIENKFLKVIFSNPDINIDQNYYFLKILRLLIWEFKFLHNNFTKKINKEELELIRLEIIRRIEFLIRNSYLNENIGEKFLLMVNLLDPLKRMQEEILKYYKTEEKEDIKLKEKEYFLSISEIIEEIHSYAKLKKRGNVTEVYSLNQKLMQQKQDFLSRTKELNISSSLIQIIFVFLEDFMSYLILKIHSEKEKINSEQNL